MNDVDLAVNCYERTYRQVLAPGFFPGLAEEQSYRFSKRTAIVNNVADRADAESRAGSLIADGELDRVFFVEDHLERALEVTGLNPSAIARAPHFTDWGIVLVTVAGPTWLVHCDPEVRMRERNDWIGPSLELMRRDARVMIANPRWYALTPRHDTLARSTFSYEDGFSLGLGFSDQLFMCKRAELAAPIYEQRCLASRRYPMANVCRTFEARIDAWMRHHDRLRATFLDAVYQHPDEIGGAYPTRRATEKLRSVVNQAVIAAAQRSPVKSRCCHAL
jgi:hypothetical protein